MRCIWRPTGSACGPGAANFRLDEIPAAVAFAHDHGVKVHVACNILMHPDDIDELPAFFRAMDAAGVDAFIIGDLAPSP